MVMVVFGGGDDGGEVVLVVDHGRDTGHGSSQSASACRRKSWSQSRGPQSGLRLP